MKPWRINSMINHTEQKVSVQPTPEFDGVELFFNSTENPNQDSGILYLNKTEVKALVNMLTSMIDYVSEKEEDGKS